MLPERKPSRSSATYRKPSSCSRAVLFGGGDFPVLNCLRLLGTVGYDDWFCLEWEKPWHPEIENPEVALPLFPAKIRKYWLEVRAG